MFVELEVRNKNWLLCPSYNSHKDNVSNYLYHLSKGLGLYLGHNSNLFVLEDLNCKISEKYLDDFCKLYSLSGIVRKQFVSKDLFLTNRT